MNSAPSGEPQPAGPRPGRRPVLVITGMSGAGRLTAMRAFEDLGYEAVDNLPLSMLRDLVKPLPARPVRPLAVGVDVRARGFGVGQLFAEIDLLAGRGDLAVQVLFFDCDTETLRRRFTETRRRHPFARGRSVTEGIEREREVLAPLRGRADRVIDTTGMAPGDLKRLLDADCGLDRAAGLEVFVTSFAYREGLPRDADLVFDVRFLGNPHYDDELRPLDGLDARVGAFIERDPEYPAFMANLEALLEPLLPRFRDEGKSYLTIAVGCTGGCHRSVFVSERLRAWLAGRDIRCAIAHRDLHRRAERTG